MIWSPDQKFGLATREQIAGLSGREFLQAMIDGRLPAPPITQTMSMRLVEVADGFAVFEGEPGPHLLNPMGGVHGGWVLTLIDSITGCAAHSTLPAGVGYASIETKGNFSRPIAPDTGRVGGRPCRRQGAHDHLGRGQDRGLERAPAGARDLDPDGVPAERELKGTAQAMSDLQPRACDRRDEAVERAEQSGAV